GCRLSVADHAPAARCADPRGRGGGPATRSGADPLTQAEGESAMLNTDHLPQTFFGLSAAFLLGGIIGFERQWRQRLAGLRTNTLVAVGAATFVIFAGLVEGDASPTRVAAQIVSGIGFLGAGIIFKEGFNVRGLNTAATLWCSAAVGVMCGAGFYAHAVSATLFIISVNLLLRPLVSLMDRQPSDPKST